MRHIIVIGAGYTGMICALGVATRTRGADVTVTLVNPSEYFTERLRLHQVAAGQSLPKHPIRDLVARSGVAVKIGYATHIDSDAATVTVDGDVLPFDRLVLALGSVAHTDLVPGATENAYTLDDPNLATHLATATGTFVVCGAGLTGVEAATEIAEAYPHLEVLLVGRTAPGGMMGAKARAHLDKQLQRLGVRVIAGNVTKVLRHGVEVDDEVIPTSGVLWTSGVRVSPLAANAGITVDAVGRVVTDSSLRSVSHPSIYAVGDAAAVEQHYGVIHGTCQSGIPMAAHAAANIARDVKGRRLRTFRFGYFHQPVSIGREEAIIQFVKGDDTPRRFWLHGWAARRYKETVSASPLTTFRIGNYLPLPARLLSFARG